MLHYFMIFFFFLNFRLSCLFGDQEYCIVNDVLIKITTFTITKSSINSVFLAELYLSHPGMLTARIFVSSSNVTDFPFWSLFNYFQGLILYATNHYSLDRVNLYANCFEEKKIPFLVVSKKLEVSSTADQHLPRACLKHIILDGTKNLSTKKESWMLQFGVILIFFKTFFKENNLFSEFNLLGNFKLEERVRHWIARKRRKNLSLNY